MVIAGYYAVFGGQYSIFDLRSARSSLGTEQARLEALHVDIDSLKARADSLQHNDATIERIAREEYGMIREGETLYRFATVRDGEPGEAAVPAR
jgi:cell division protein FtsB